MASVHPRENKHGVITSYQVKWRLGGGRKGPWQSETFDDEESAKVFKAAVDEHGQQWPPGWVKGQGYIDPNVGDETRYLFRHFALESIKNRTGIGGKYRRQCIRELETYVFPTFGNCDVRSTEHFSSSTIRAWVRKLEQTKVWRGSQLKPMSPKTIHNIHGLLSSILYEAVKTEPPLRARNPCELTRLPRVDDDGAADDESEDIEFLEPREVDAIVECLAQPEDRLLVRVAYGTGLRWGELTALARRHLLPPDPEVTAQTNPKAHPRIRVARAWKLDPDEDGYYLGTPKTKGSRRTVRVTAGLWRELDEHRVFRLRSGDLVFHNASGERLPYSTFYDRWVKAVAAAQEAGTLPDHKRPTFHDLRHSHAAALISAGHSLTYVQRRLGHESITTTSNVYGHLLPQADDAAMETIEAALGGRPGDTDGQVQALPSPPDAPLGGSVFVAHLGGRLVGCWVRDHAEEAATRWQSATGDTVRVEEWSLAWWQRSVPNGRHEIYDSVPGRMVWELGPAVYGPDGAERVTEPRVHQVRGRWVWAWDEAFTDEPALSRAEWLPDGTTEAAAWGLDQGAVRAAYEQARTDALRICSLNPAVAGDRDAVT